MMLLTCIWLIMYVSGEAFVFCFVLMQEVSADDKAGDIREGDPVDYSSVSLVKALSLIHI